MSYDTEAIRDKVSMIDLLAKDGIEVQRKGGRWFARCPFHEEKSASFSVTERTGLFTCFGCGAGKKDSGIKGDIFGYWMATRGVDFLEAAKALAQIAGTGELPDGTRLPPKKVAANQALYIPPALAGRDLDKWDEGVRFLAGSEEWQAKLAAWRGYSRDTIGALIERKLIGLPLYFQARCWAMPVIPIGPENETFLAGWHVRVEPSKAGEKSSWRFVPGEGENRPSMGAWPLVIGDPRTARVVIFTEGEWDAFAAADITAWGVEAKTAENIAIIGIRGGRNLRTVLAWHWPETAQAFLFPDNDDTGMSWLDPDGFASIVRARSKAVHCFTFPDVKDLNDLHRNAGPGHRAEWRAFFRVKFIAGKKTRKPRQPKLTPTP